MTPPDAPVPPDTPPVGSPTAEAPPSAPVGLPLGTLRRGRGVLEISGVTLGHAEHTEAGRLTGVTVIVPPAGSMAGVDVRGGGPASHETAILAPGTLNYGADAVVLTGGSAHGLVTAHGVAQGLLADDAGFPAPGLPGVTVPIVPAAGIFDLGRGGSLISPPTAEDGFAAYRDARPDQDRLRGSVGAGVGAWTGRGLMRGGLGQAVITTPAGFRVAALVVANPMGTVLGPDGRLHGVSVLARYGVALPVTTGIGARFAEFYADKGAADGWAISDSARNTTIACIVTDAALDQAMTTRLAQSAHAGLARAIHPSHTLFDGDTVFAIATGGLLLSASEDPDGDAGDAARAELEAARLVELNLAAADVLTAAIVDAVLSATTDPLPQRITATGQPTPPPLSAFAPDTVAAWQELR